MMIRGNIKTGSKNYDLIGNYYICKYFYMEAFIKKIREAYPLSDEAVRLLVTNTERVVLPRGEILIREGIVARYTYIIVKGFARGFFHKEGKDITIWFASEGMSLLSMNGYMFSTAGYENVELMEECDLLKINRFTTVLPSQQENLVPSSHTQKKSSPVQTRLTDVMNVTLPLLPW